MATQVYITWDAREVGNYLEVNQITLANVAPVARKPEVLEAIADSLAALLRRGDGTTTVSPPDASGRYALQEVSPDGGVLWRAFFDGNTIRYNSSAFNATEPHQFNDLIHLLMACIRKKYDELTVVEMDGGRLYGHKQQIPYRWR